MSGRNPVTDAKLSRRTFLVAGSLTGVAAFLAACGTSGASTPPATPTAGPTAGASPTATPEPTPKPTTSAELNWANWTYYMDVDPNDATKFPTLEQFKAKYGTTLVTGFAYIHGYAIGILANNGVLMSESAGKGAQFIHLCNQQNIPLVFLQNITGFMVGRSYEEQGIIRNGAKLINAVSNSTVPAITIMIGSSYGAGNYAMCGRAYEPRFLFTWPNHRIAVMGPQQLSGVMDIIKREALNKQGLPIDEEKLVASKLALEAQIEAESDPYFATARLWDDGIIDPRDTRTILAISLSAAYNRPVEGTMEWGVFRH